MKNPVEKLGEEKITKILQQRELIMLKQVKRVFEKNNIDFCLACGTALGCIRHQGFIPWDDDIDIYIRGKDYEKVREAFKKDGGTLQFQDYQNVNNYPYTFPKIVDTDTVLIEKSLSHLDYQCGVYIDIFPIYGISDFVLLRNVKEWIRYVWYGILRAYYFSFDNGMRGLFSSVIRHLVNPYLVQKKLKNTYCNDKDDTQIMIESGGFGKRAQLKSKYFISTTMLPFEGILLPVCVGYDSYLTEYYGDYMSLPPEKERVSRHHFAELLIPGVDELAEE